ncbi:geminin-like [Ostrinia nubilalis]|uniref:geminin-like n=1 Tax=Ostrinia furnacalis TaxID=93504 RepID=UPI00103D0FCA|nr:geminin-like [Ostrinia furnacalis]
MSSQEESTRVTRRSLKTLQHTASDRENLVGRPSKSLKHQLSQEPSVDIEVKRKNLSTKETQADLDTKVSIDDLTNPEGASEKYWKILAEKRQQALQEALDENEKLLKIIDDLKEENRATKQMLEEANSFIEVVKEELANDNNDTGIDVNDVSTADETDDQSKPETDNN